METLWPRLFPKPPLSKKRGNLSQSDCPAFSLLDALKVSRALADNYANGPEAPHNVAIACELSPTSSQWHMLAGAALAYGLTTGSFSAVAIENTDIANRIHNPVVEGDDEIALQEATLAPRIAREFFTRYDRNKFPPDNIAQNVLISSGIPRERATVSLGILKSNGEAAGFITQTRTGPFVALTISGKRTAKLAPDQNLTQIRDEREDQSSFGEQQSQFKPLESLSPWDQPIKRVFVSHGKNQKILDQVKEIVDFGKFEPVVSKDRETVSKPVPDKVMDDMRACHAAVIHVAGEQVMTDSDGTLHRQINGNVLIEIGAAMALYKRRFILLVEDGLTLPSNLQGLYEVRYTGDHLNESATMKLLKAFNDFV